METAGTTGQGRRVCNAFAARAKPSTCPAQRGARQRQTQWRYGCPLDPWARAATVLQQGEDTAGWCGTEDAPVRKARVRRRSRRTHPLGAQRQLTDLCSGVRLAFGWRSGVLQAKRAAPQVRRRQGWKPEGRDPSPGLGSRRPGPRTGDARKLGQKAIETLTHQISDQHQRQDRR